MTSVVQRSEIVLLNKICQFRLLLFDLFFGLAFVLINFILATLWVYYKVLMLLCLLFLPIDDIFLEFSDGYLVSLMLQQKLCHLVIISQDCIVDRYHALVIKRSALILPKLLMREPFLMLMQQVFENLQSIVHRSDVNHVLPLLVFLVKLEAFAAHQHFNHHQTNNMRNVSK